MGSVDSFARRTPKDIDVDQEAPKARSIPAWGNAPDKRSHRMEGQRPAPLAIDLQSTWNGPLALAPLIRKYLGLRPRLVWRAPLALVLWAASVAGRGNESRGRHARAPQIASRLRLKIAFAYSEAVAVSALASGGPLITVAGASATGTRPRMGSSLR